MGGRLLFLAALLRGCSLDSDLPQASSRWNHPAGLRWQAEGPVPEVKTLSVELEGSSLASTLFDALVRAQRAGVKDLEIVAQTDGRVVGLPVELPAFCPARRPYARGCGTARLMLRSGDAELLYLEATPDDCTNRLFEPVQRPLGEIAWVELDRIGPETLGTFELLEVGVCDHVGLAAEPDVPLQRVVEAYDALARTGVERIVFTVGIRERR